MPPESFMPIAYHVELKDARKCVEMVEKFKSIPGVGTVKSPYKTVETIVGIQSFIRILGGIILLILIAAPILIYIIYVFLRYSCVSTR
jgi:cell division protein FtsX